MSGLWSRGVKVMALFGAAVLVVLTLELVVAGGAVPTSALPWSHLLDQLAGRPGAAVVPDTPEAPYLWPVYADSGLAGAIVYSRATGYRSPVEVAVAVDATGAVRATEVVAHGESGYVARALGRGDVDGVTGATVTSDAIGRARERAVRAATRYIEEQR